MRPTPRAALILQGTSNYQSLDALNRELARVLETMGVTPLLLDMARPEQADPMFVRIQHEWGFENIVAAFSFSGIGADFGDRLPAGNLWQRARVPVLSWLLDHPCYHLRRHSPPAAAIMRVYGVRDFLDFNQSYVRAPGRSGYCPFGAISYGRAAKRRQPKGNETPLIIFPKSGDKTSELEALWARYPSFVQQLIRGAIEEYWAQQQRSGPVVNAVLRAADATGLELRHDLPLFTFFVAQVDDYIRARKTRLAMEQALRYPVRIYTQTLLPTDHTTKATVLSPINAFDMIDLFHEALAVININPNVDDHGHDRLYSSFGCGALPISDTNPWWEGGFPDLRPYTYDFSTRSLGAALEAVLHDPAAAAETAWQVGERMRRERPFEKAVAQLLDMARLHRFFTFDFPGAQPGYVRHGD